MNVTQGDSSVPGGNAIETAVFMVLATPTAALNIFAVCAMLRVRSGKYFGGSVLPGSIATTGASGAEDTFHLSLVILVACDALLCLLVVPTSSASFAKYIITEDNGNNTEIIKKLTIVEESFKCLLSTTVVLRNHWMMTLTTLRFMVVSKPVKSGHLLSAWLSKRLLLIQAVIAALISICYISTTNAFQTNSARINLIVELFIWLQSGLPAIYVALVSTALAAKLRSHSRRLRRSASTSRSSSKHQGQSRSAKAAMVTLLLAVIFVVCEMPTLVFTLLQQKNMALLATILNKLLLMDSLLNVLVLLTCSQHFREACLSLLLKNRREVVRGETDAQTFNLLARKKPSRDCDTQSDVTLLTPAKTRACNSP